MRSLPHEPTEEELGITQEMVEAGMAALHGYCPMDVAFPVGGEDDAVRAVLRAAFLVLETGGSRQRNTQYSLSIGSAPKPLSHRPQVPQSPDLSTLKTIVGADGLEVAQFGLCIGWLKEVGVLSPQRTNRHEPNHSA